MKLLFRFLSVILLFSLHWSCAKKKYPPSVTEDEAVYYSRFMVDGQPTTLEAGKDDYYMYASVTKDSDQVYNLVSDLRKTDCISCPLGLKIQINDYRSSGANALINIDSAIQPKKYPYFRKGTEAGYKVQFSSTYNKTAASPGFHWFFDDGTEAFGTSPEHLFITGGKHDVCLKVSSSDFCTNNICNTLDIRNGGLLTSVNGIAAGNKSISFSHSTTGGKAPYQFLWSFGDGQVQSLESPTHTYSFQGSYAVLLRVIDAAGDTAYSNYNAVTSGDNSSCAANYKITNVVPLGSGSQSWAKVIITWKDAQGVEFRSAEEDQPASSFFEIVSVEQGSVNEKGEQTKKLKVKFNCRLFNGSRQINIENAEATIGVAYK